VPLRAERVQPLAPRLVGQAEQAAPAVDQQVEHQVGDRDGGGEPGDLGAAGAVHAVLQQPEVGAAQPVEGHHLAVEDGVGPCQDLR
jgi:hypothetical protein